MIASCFGQYTDPDGAHVDMYFPQLADGGPPAQQWQTSFVFVNPHSSLTAHVQLSLFGNDGKPLGLNLGAGLASVYTFSVLPGGSITLRSSVTSAVTLTGWALAVADIPLQATVLYRYSANGVPQVEVSAPATLPSGQYLSPATHDLGIALVNIYSVQRTFAINAFDSSGSFKGSNTVSLGPLSHTSLTLGQLIPAISTAFSGSVQIVSQSNPTDQFLAWTLNSDRGLIASLPSGRLAWPISHTDRILLVYKKLLAASPSVFSGLGISGVNLNSQTVSLTVSTDQVINAFGHSNGNVQINLALSELVSDSPSELAFVVGHELGHIAQYQRGLTVGGILLPNREQDADLIGLSYLLGAGYDPYAGAGLLGKLYTATGQAGVVASAFDDLIDPHGSFNTRADTMFTILSLACLQPSAAAACATYKSVVHPHLPPSAPLFQSNDSRP